ncbi:hypothetical protein Taro_002381 [Colocasia esculenta]|uniref:Uncharacterized protein n=1 Tax=Colocasia esculenta TaxID=4460 RepID=A0A843TGE1_COLES|nr:hypothetical protein [Colocasia esculenta]
MTVGEGHSDQPLLLPLFLHERLLTFTSVRGATTDPFFRGGLRRTFDSCSTFATPSPNLFRYFPNCECDNGVHNPQENPA